MAPSANGPGVLASSTLVITRSASLMTSLFSENSDVLSLASITIALTASFGANAVLTNVKSPLPSVVVVPI